MHPGGMARTFVGWMVVVALAFAQLAASAHACTFAWPDDAVAAHAHADGCEDGNDAALCEGHCHDAAHPKPAFELPPLQPAFVFRLHPCNVEPSPGGLRVEPALQRATSPPISLSHCVLRL